MKSRFLLAMIFVLGLGTSGYYSQAAATPNIQPSLGCCGGDPGQPLPTPQIPSPVPPPPPPSAK